MPQPWNTTKPSEPQQETLFSVLKLERRGGYAHVQLNLPYTEASHVARELVALQQANMTKVVYGRQETFVEAWSRLDGKVVKW
jgi:hypothetical protein